MAALDETVTVNDRSLKQQLAEMKQQVSRLVEHTTRLQKQLDVYNIPIILHSVEDIITWASELYIEEYIGRNLDSPWRFKSVEDAVSDKNKYASEADMKAMVGIFAAHLPGKLEEKAARLDYISRHKPEHCRHTASFQSLDELVKKAYKLLANSEHLRAKLPEEAGVIDAYFNEGRSWLTQNNHDIMEAARDAIDASLGRSPPFKGLLSGSK